MNAPEVRDVVLSFAIMYSFLFPVIQGISREQVLKPTLRQEKVPPLADRWTEGMTFVDFLGTTFKQYYDWNKN